MKKQLYLLLTIINILLSYGTVAQCGTGEAVLIITKGIGKNKAAKVKISYFVLDGESKVISTALKEIDLSTYPNPKLRIEVEVLELRKNYEIRFSEFSVNNEIQGFSVISSLPVSLKKVGDKYQVDYQYNPKSIDNENLNNQLVVSIFAYKGEKKKASINCNSSRYTFRLPPSEQENAEKLHLKLIKAKKDDDPKSIENHCEEFKKIYANNTEVTRALKDKVEAICNAPILEFIVPPSDTTPTSDEYYTQITNASEEQNLVNLFNDYTNEYDRTDANAEKIYAHLATSNLVATEQQVEYCKQYLNTFSGGTRASIIQERLNGLFEAQNHEEHETNAIEDSVHWKQVLLKVGGLTKRVDKINLYKRYLSQHTIFAKEAKEALGALYVPFAVEEIGEREKDGNWSILTFNISGADGLEIKIDGLNNLSQESWTDTIINLRLKSDTLHTLTFYLPDDKDKSKEVTLDLKLAPLWLENVEETGHQLILEISGGKPPYSIQLKDASGIVIKKEELTAGNDRWILNKEKLSDDLDGKYTICVVDAYNANTCGDGFFYEASSSSLSWIVLPLVLLLLVGIGYFLYNKYRRSEKADAGFVAAIEVRRKEALSAEVVVAEEEGEEIVTPVRKKIQIKAKKRQRNISEDRRTIPPIIETPPPIVGASTKPPIPPKMNRPQVFKKAKLEKIEGMEVPAFLLDAKYPNKYRMLQLTHFWENTLVEALYIHQVCAAKIHNFVFLDNGHFLHIKNETIPEIGGCILGKHLLNDNTGKYEVSFERFIELETKGNLFSFGTEAWVKITSQLDTHADDNLEIIGWLHTHIDGTVLLSSNDIKTHEVIFDKPYQIAMVMDNANAPHDVGFFTRQENHNLNNNKDMSTGYLTWNAFTKWLQM